MARDFSGSGQYLASSATPPVLTYPLTIYALINADSLSGASHWFSFDQGTTNHTLRCRPSGTSLQFVLKAAGANVFVSHTSSSLSVDTWHAVALSIPSGGGSAITMIDGTQQSHSSLSIPSIASCTGMTVAAWDRGYFAELFNGSIAHIAVYDTDLDAAQLDALNQRVSPRVVAPQNLKFLLEMSGAAGTGDEVDIIGQTSFVATGSPPAVESPYVTMPWVSSINAVAAAAGGNHTRSPAKGDLTLTGQAPALTLQHARLPAKGDLTLTGQAPALALQHLRSPAKGDLTFTGQAPVFTLQHIRSPAKGDLTWTGHAPTADITEAGNESAMPPVGALTLAGQAPGVTLQLLTEPAVGALTWTGHAPDATVSADRDAAPGVGSLTLTGHAPTVDLVLKLVVAPGAGSISFTGHAPTVVDSGAVVARATGAGGGLKKRRAPRRLRYPRRISLDGRLVTVRSPAEERRVLEEWRQQLVAQSERADLPIGRKKRIRIKAEAVVERIERVDDREAEWLGRLKDEDEELLMLLASGR